MAFDRLRNNALVGAAPKLPLLRQMLLRTLTAAGIPLPDYELRPHLSLAYGKGPLRNIPISRIGWLADEVLLVRSVHGVGHRCCNAYR